MSQWTHIAGIIRVNTLRGLVGMPGSNEDVENVIRRLLGPTCNFDSSQEEWDACGVPCGSLGSLQYYIHCTRRGSSIAWGYIALEADLRNYDSWLEICEWLEKVTKDFNEEDISIRNMAVEIEVEYQKTIVVTYNEGLKIQHLS